MVTFLGKKLISSKHHGNRNCWAIWIDTMGNTVYVEHHQGGGGVVNGMDDLYLCHCMTFILLQLLTFLLYLECLVRVLKCTSIYQHKIQQQMNE